jgi:hypothetical protein
MEIQDLEYMLRQEPTRRAMSRFERVEGLLRELSNNPSELMARVVRQRGGLATKELRETCQDLLHALDDLEIVLLDVAIVNTLKKDILFRHIEDGEVTVMGVSVHVDGLDELACCFRCIKRLKNPDGSRFDIRQAAAEDIILESDDTKLSGLLKEEGCELCRHKSTPDQEIVEVTQNSASYCHVCHRPFVRL